MSKKGKIISIILALCLVVIVAFTAISCNDGSGSNDGTTEILPTLTKVKIIPEAYGHNGDEESDVCLSLSGGKVERFHIEITISNPDKREILSFNYNDLTYESDHFDAESTPSRIVVKNLTAPVQEGSFEVKIDEIKYANTSGTAKIYGLKDNVKRVVIQPTFKLTLDYSKANLNDGEEAIKVVDNEYLAHFNLPSDNDMNETSTTVEDKHVYGHNGYIFAGWYTEEGGQGTQYLPNDSYHLYKDITLYAHYARAIKYVQEENYLVVTALTPEGVSTSFDIIIPSEIDGLPVRKIGYRAFAGSATNKTIILPDTIVEIGDYAFANSTGLKIDFGSVEKIGLMAFSGCGKITLGKNRNFFSGSATLPNTLKEIGNSAFRGCYWNTRSLNPYNSSSFRPELPTLLLPPSIEKIGNNAFMESGFYAVYFSSASNLTLDNFGTSVFEGSKNLSSIFTSFAHLESGPTFTTSGKSGVVDFPARTFYNCTALKTSMSAPNVKLNEGLESIGELAFASSGEGMKEFTYLTLPNSLLEIGKQAFANTALSTVTFNKESKLQKLGDYCFENSKFEEITIYNLRSYGMAPFWGNTKIKAINILSPTLPTYTETNVWGAGLTRKTKYYVKKELLNSYRSENSSWAKDDVQDYVCAYDFITEDSYGTKLCFEPINDEGELDFNSTNVRITSVFDLNKEIRIPRTILYNDVTYNVVSVGKYFVHDDVTKIRLPSTLERIETRAFYTCDVLYECVWMNENQELNRGMNKDIALRYIGQDAFNGSAITYFYSNKKLEVIGKQAFHNCKNLSTVVLNYGTQLCVMGSAFSQSGLRTLAIGLNVERVYDSAFQNNQSLTVVLIALSAVPLANGENYPGLGSSPLGYCDNINKVYLFSNNALTAFTSSKTPNGQINGWSGVKNPNGTTKYEIYSGGTWEEALDYYNV